MRLLPAPLIRLILMRARGTLRRWLRTLRKPKGIIAFIFALGLFSLWLVPVLISSRAGPAPSVRPPLEQVDPSGEPAPTPSETQRPFGLPATPSLPEGDWGPFVVVGLALLSLLGSGRDSGLGFLPAEVDLLFPAPFTRRQLVAYKVAERMIPLFALSLVMSLWTSRFAGSLAAAWMGTFLVLWFVNLLSMSIALLGQLLGTRRFRTARLTLIALVVAAVAIGTWWLSRQRGLELFEALVAFTRSPAGVALSLPGVPFARIFQADTLSGAGLWALVSLAIDAGLLALVLRLDADWLESSLESSRRLEERLKRAKAGGGVSALPTDSRRLTSLRLPMPPRLGGAGPIAWCSAVQALRGSLRGLWVILVMVAAASVPMLMAGGSTRTFMPVVGAMLITYTTLLLPQILRLDFRGEIDRLDVLKSLPVSPGRVTLAMIGLAAIVVTLIEWLLAVPILLLLPWHVPAVPLWAIALLGVNLVSIGLDNAAFLLWPSRPRQGPGMTMASGQFFIQILKFLVLAGCLGVAAAPAALVGLALPRDLAFAGAAATALVVLAAEAAGVVALTALLFRRFDPADQPLPES